MRNKTIIVIAVVLFFAYVIGGGLITISAHNEYQSQLGRVWNALNTGAEKIQSLQLQVQVPTDLVRDVMTNLSAARNDILAAQQSGDVVAALSAYDRASVELNALTEAYPDLIDLGPLYTTLMDETSGAFNRVSYARDNLIDAQIAYNSTCIYFPLHCERFDGTVDVLGAGSDPSARMNIPPMGQ